MGFPPNTTTCRVTFGTALSTLGGAATITATIVVDRVLIHAASGQAIYPTAEAMQVAGDGSTYADVLVVDQPGFRDAAENTVTGWSYTLSGLIAFAAGGTQPVTKTFQVFTGQTTVDLDLVPSGTSAPAVSAPTQYVTSVNGQTGAVDLSATSARAVATGPGVVTLVNGAPRITVTTPWGIRANGTPYYTDDPAGAPQGEAAVLDINPANGAPRLTLIGA